MPELPEVQNVKENLKKYILNKKITDIVILYEKICEDNLDILINKTVHDIKTFGKYIVFNLSSQVNLIVHLRMEGKFFIKMKDDELTKHDHIIFKFDDFDLRYNDTRKFGKMCVRKEMELFTLEPLKSLAKEPFTMNKDDFYNSIKKKNIPIKVVLLDQKIIAGIGNIYADEILFLSKIFPTRKASSLSRKESDSIIDNAIITLNKAIFLGGSTIHSYNSLGVDGKFQNELLVHTRENKKCATCGNTIKKIKVGGRGTYVCEFCQK